MPTVISTSTQATATQAFNQRKIDRNQDGTLWSFANAAAASVTPQYSKDNGATWTAATALAGLTNASLFIDLDDYAHVVWTQFGTAGPNGARLSVGFIYYMRGTPNAGRTAWTWSTAKDVSNDAGAVDFSDIIAARNPATGGWDTFIVHSYQSSGGGYAIYLRIPISPAGVQGTPSADGLGRINTSGGILNAAVSPGGVHTYPSIDFNHTGDGKTVAGGTPHLYVGWTAGATGAGKGVRFRKAVYSAGAWTWNAEREIDPTQSVSTVNGDSLLTMFDGTRAVMAGQLSTGTNTGEFIYERDAADTTTTVRKLLQNGTGGTGAVSTDILSGGSATFDPAGNVYLFGSDSTGPSNGTYKLNYRKWTRATATLGPIVTFDTTGSQTPYISAKRGYSANSIDWVYTDGTASPYNVTFERIALPPLTPYVPAIML